MFRYLLAAAAALTLASSGPVADKAALNAQIARAPLAFEQNGSEWMARAPAYSASLAAGGVIVRFGGASQVHLSFCGAKAEPPRGIDELPGKVNYLLGRDPKLWRRGVATYARVRYANVYPGIDAVWYGNGAQLEYDFVVHPGADPASIGMRVDGAATLALENDSVRIGTPGGAMYMRLPALYQDVAGKRHSVKGRFVLRHGNEVDFELGEYDRAKTLIIDPTLVYSAPLLVRGSAIAADGSGDVYVITTAPPESIATNGAMQRGLAGGSDCVITKFDSSGAVQVYSTYLGGSNGDSCTGIAVDGNGNAVVAGGTSSPDFPTVNAGQNRYAGNGDVFVAKLNATGDTLLMSTYLGGPNGDFGGAVATDAAGNVFVVGQAGHGFPTTTLAATSQYTDAFVAEIPAGAGSPWVTLIGQNGATTLGAVAADTEGNVYTGGMTCLNSFPGNPPGAIPSTVTGCHAFVAKFRPGTIGEVWLTFLARGAASDDISGIALDGAGTVFVAGTTSSTDIPVTAGATRSRLQGGQDGFVVGIRPDGMSFTMGTYLGGASDETLKSLSMGPAGQLIVAGSTLSSDFPIASAIQPAIPQSGSSLYISSDSGVTWTQSTFLSNVAPSFSLDPTNPDAIVATVSGSVMRSVDGGRTWQRTTFASQGFAAARSSSVPSVLYVGSWDGTRYSSDGGATWAVVNTADLCSEYTSTAVVSPTDPNTLLVFTNCGEYRSTNRGASFTLIDTDIYFGVWALASPDGAIYIGSSQYARKSTDGGFTWTALNVRGFIFDEFNGPIVIDPANPKILYANVAGSLYKSTDAGTSWVRTGSGNGSTAIAAGPGSGVLYGITDEGQVSITTDAGASWTFVSNSLDILSFQQFQSSPVNRARLFASTLPTQSGFVTKLRTDGSLIWSTYFGAAAGSTAFAAAGPAGDVWITGLAPNNPPNTSASLGSSDDLGYLAHVLDATAACSYVVSPTAYYSYTTGTQAQTLYAGVVAPSGCTWTAVASDPWLTVKHGASGAGVSTLAVGIAPNLSGATRSGAISVNGTNIEVIQPAATCTYAVDTAMFTAPPAGGSFIANVTAPPGCPWNFRRKMGQVTMSPASGSGNGTVTFTVPPNLGVQDDTAWVTVGTQPVLFTVKDACTFSISPGSPAVPGNGGAGSIFVWTSRQGCVWNGISDESWLVLNQAYGTGNGTIAYTADTNTFGQSRTAHITMGDQTFTVTQPPAVPLGFYALTPCRIADTRDSARAGAFGPPYLGGYSDRNFPISTSNCGVPASAQAYVLNATVLPQGTLGYLSLWSSGQPFPTVSTLNSGDGAIIANAAIVPAGANGTITARATDNTDLILDVNGYFAPPTGSELLFYPITPCRAVDTRAEYGKTGPFGPPALGAYKPRDFSIPASGCGVPPSAAAYALNVTVVPHGSLGYLSAWPAGQPFPTVSTLNSLNGSIVANAAIVPAGVNGDITMLATDATDLIVDVNGYFAPPSPSGLHFYPLPPCRVADTRNGLGPLGGPALAGAQARAFTIARSCGAPYTAQAFSLNVTVVPQGPLGYLSIWPDGQPFPVVSTLNSPRGKIIANAAIVPRGPNGVAVLASNATDLIVDINGYFAP